MFVMKHSECDYTPIGWRIRSFYPLRKRSNEMLNYFPPNEDTFYIPVDTLNMPTSNRSIIIEFTHGATMEITPNVLSDCFNFSKDDHQWYTLYGTFAPDLCIDVVYGPVEPLILQCTSDEVVEAMTELRFKIQDLADHANVLAKIEFKDACARLSFSGIYGVPHTLCALVKNIELLEQRRVHRYANQDSLSIIEESKRSNGVIITRFYNPNNQSPIIRETFPDTLCLQNVVHVDCPEKPCEE
ncbi:hypothetical protein [Ranid herpesvirus 3]|uniref:Uncharacterized protein n=1 Tax=Ranid herpesvirus 3 TaxID=1987509 RepID=A0A1X9T590_9VIRU|nr:hypothetical protein [Ranid herpesvirus 3]ARR28871.1 hypothetical protein [Ranid herpesvirus 3]